MNHIEKRIEKRKHDFRDTEASETERGPETEEKTVQNAANNERSTLDKYPGFTETSMVP